MTKKKSTNMAVGLVNGSMAVAKQAAKVKTVTRKRHFLQSNVVMSDSTQVLSASQSPYAVGSQYSSETLLFKCSSLSQNATQWIEKFDKYRITEVEVFATLFLRSRNGAVDRSAPVEIFFYEDTDADPTTTTSWIRTGDRDNVGRVVLNAFHPSARLISFKPTITFAADQSSQSPSNVVPKKDTWLDALALEQLHSGLRVFTACGQTDQSGQSYEYSVGFQARYTVEVSQPL